MQRYQEELETKVKGSNYTFERVDLLEYHLHKVTLNRGSSYIPSQDWLSHKNSTINPFNDKDNRCFLYAIVIAVNYQHIANNPQRISNLIPFIVKYNWNRIDFPAGHKDCSAFEKNNTNIALKSISGLLRGITSNHNADFYCLCCFHWYRTANKLKKHEDLSKNYDFCNLKLPKPEKKYLLSIWICYEQKSIY